MNDDFLEPLIDAMERRFDRLEKRLDRYEERQRTDSRIEKVLRERISDLRQAMDAITEMAEKIKRSAD